MKKVLKKSLLLIVAVFAVSIMLVPAMADNYPASDSGVKQPAPAVSSSQQKIFYGYVPPPPIRQTWPGGYRVIFHELINTLMEHCIGWY